MLHWVLKNAAHYHFLRMNGCAILLFMWPINIFSGIFAIPQPRSNTAYACTPFLISFPHVAFETVPMLIRDKVVNCCFPLSAPLLQVFGGVSVSSSTLKIFHSTSHLRWLFCNPVYLFIHFLSECRTVNKNQLERCVYPSLSDQLKALPY